MGFKIIQEPHELLHKKSEAIENFEEAKEIAARLLSAIENLSTFWNRWLGLAANQLGYLKRIVVLRQGRHNFLVMVNPEILERKWPFPYLERCHSVKGLYVVKRYLWARLRYQDLTGQQKEIILRGPSAIYQEIDHLEGILVTEIGSRIL